MEEKNNKIEGTLVSWDDARGFGFAAVAGAEESVFIHVKGLLSRHVRPAVGDTLRFRVAEGRNGRSAAAEIEIVGAPPPKRPEPPRVAPMTARDLSRLVAAIWIIVGAVLCVALGRAPVWFGGLYFIMSLASGLLYWFDKAYARQGRSRVREISLHLSDALFGIAGGLMAQHVFRHKTRKAAFRYVTRLIFVVHATLQAALLGQLIRI